MTISKYPALLFLLFTFGCSAVPLSHRATLTHPASGTPPVHVEGTHGPLSVQQTKEILASLKQSAPETSIFTKHLKLEEEIAGSPLMSGNKVTLLIDGPATYKSMYAAIEAARNHIDLETYDIEADEVGRKFVGALRAKQRSGIQVNLIYDSIGSHTTPKDFFKQLSDSGAHVLEFNPITPLTLLKAWKVGRDHRKLLVVDGQVAFVGGVNISSVYSSGSFKSKPHSKKIQPWRDTHIRIEGPVVSEFQKFFLAPAAEGMAVSATM
jgi:cardiolipin synthase